MVFLNINNTCIFAFILNYYINLLLLFRENISRSTYYLSNIIKNPVIFINIFNISL
jgi:hypothetical protein